MNEAACAGNDGDMQAQAGADQYLTFMLAGEEYGVDILRVQEIKGWDSVTPIPNTPDYVLGVINLRGTVVPVIDLRRRFAMPASDFGPTTVVIVLRVSGADHDRTIGIVVDAVSEVYNVSADAVGPAPDFGDAAATGFVKGLTRVGERMMILLDTDNLIEIEDVEADVASTH